MSKLLRMGQEEMSNNGGRGEKVREMAPVQDDHGILSGIGGSVRETICMKHYLLETKVGLVVGGELI